MDALEESIEVREYDIGPGELEYCIPFACRSTAARRRSGTFTSPAGRRQRRWGNQPPLL